MRKVVTLFCLVVLGLSQSHAQRKPGAGKPGNNKPGSGDPIPSPGNAWVKRYKGKPQFKLSDNQKYRNFQVTATTTKKKLKTAEAKVDGAQKKVKNLKNQLDQISKELVSTNKALTEKQTNLSTSKDKLKTLQDLVETSKLALVGAQKIAEEKVAKVQVATEKHKKLKEACDANPTAECAQKVKEAFDKLQPLIAAAKKASDKVKEFEEKISSSSKKIAEIKTSIPKLQSDISALSTKKKELAVKSKSLNTSLTKANGELKATLSSKTKLEGEYRKVMIAFTDYHKALVADILMANRAGLQNARRDGLSDGDELAKDRGSSFGHRDGRNIGLIEGENQGRAREYQAGKEEGRVKGTQQGTSEGIAQGSKDGEVAGNKIAAKRESSEQANIDANNSDAREVGERKGITAGMQRAQSTGHSRGKEIGEEQSIRENESKALESVKIMGPYAGAFNNDIPPFPPRFLGPRFNPRGNFRGPIMVQAYKDGYQFEYLAAAREGYYAIIEVVYKRVFDRAFIDARDEALARYYKEDYEQGYNELFQPSYDSAYSVAYDQHFSEKKEAFSSNPNRNSSEYKKAYSSHYSSEYSRYYGLIEEAAFKVAEKKEFQRNIAEQTEKFRKVYYENTQEIYQTKPVLKFVGASYSDGGVQGVAAKDGIYQPSEKVIGSVEVINYGQVSAKSVQVQLSNGSASSIEIPAQSSVQVIGAVQGAVSGSQSLGSSFNMVGSIALNAGSGIESRHFESAHVLKSLRESFQIEYPVSVNSLSFESQPIAGKENKLQLKFTNKGSRSYQGPIEIKLSVEGIAGASVKNFDNLSELSSSKVLSGASVIIDESEALKSFSVQGLISKNGVTLGVLEKDLKEVTHTIFSDKKGTPILMVDSYQDNKGALDVVSELGGLSKVSVLDVSLKGNQIKGGLKKRTIIMAGAYTSDIDKVLSKSSEMSIVMVSDKQSIKELRKASSLKDSYMLMYSYEGKRTPLLLAEKQSVISQQVSLASLEEALKDAEIYKMTSSEMVSKIKEMGSNVSADSKDLQLMNIMAFHQVKKINSVFVTLSSRKQRKFGKKQLPKEDFFVQKLGRMGAENKVLMSYAFDVREVMEELVEKGSTESLIDKKLAKDITKVAKDVSKGAGKDLKKVDKGVYDYINDNTPVFLPKLELL